MIKDISHIISAKINLKEKIQNNTYFIITNIIIEIMLPNKRTNTYMVKFIFQHNN